MMDMEAVISEQLLCPERLFSVSGCNRDLIMSARAYEEQRNLEGKRPQGVWSLDSVIIQPSSDQKKAPAGSNIAKLCERLLNLGGMETIGRGSLQICP
jgi:hypothetical protein